MQPRNIGRMNNWAKARGGGALVGTVAISFHVRLRITQELEILVLDRRHVSHELAGFGRLSPVLLRHRGAGVEVNIVSPVTLEVPREITEEVVWPTRVSNGGGVRASESALVALQVRRRRQDDLTGFRRRRRECRHSAN